MLFGESMLLAFVFICLAALGSCEVSMIGYFPLSLPSTPVTCNSFLQALSSAKQQNPCMTHLILISALTDLSFPAIWSRRDSDLSIVIAPCANGSWLKLKTAIAAVKLDGAKVMLRLTRRIGRCGLIDDIEGDGIANLVQELNLDGIELQFVSSDTKCEGTPLFANDVTCNTDEKYIRTITSLRSILPRPKLLSAYVGGFDTDCLLGETSEFSTTTRQDYQALRHSGELLDFITAVVFDEDSQMSTYQPITAVDHFKLLYSGPVFAGFDVTCSRGNYPHQLPCFNSDQLSTWIDQSLYHGAAGVALIYLLAPDVGNVGPQLISDLMCQRLALHGNCYPKCGPKGFCSLSGFCICREQYTGIDCSIAPEWRCEPECIHGKCIYFNGKSECLCEDNWSGPQCNDQNCPVFFNRRALRNPRRDHIATLSVGSLLDCGRKCVEYDPYAYGATSRSQCLSFEYSNLNHQCVLSKAAYYESVPSPFNPDVTYCGANVSDTCQADASPWGTCTAHGVRCLFKDGSTNCGEGFPPVCLIDCGDHGTCNLTTAGSAVCVCQKEWGGPDCRQPLDNTCQHCGVNFRGRITGLCINDGQCECRMGFNGTSCDTTPDSPISLLFYSSQSTVHREVALESDFIRLASSNRYSHIVFAYAKPRLVWPSDNWALRDADTGMSLMYDNWEELANEIQQAKLHNVKVLLGLGGPDPCYQRWDIFSPQSIRRFVTDMGFDGVNIDYITPKVTCFPTQNSSTIPACDTDSKYISIISELRAVLPRPFIVSASVSSAGAFQLDTTHSPNQGREYQVLRQAGYQLDFITVSLINPHQFPTNSPEAFLKAYRAIYGGPILLGIHYPLLQTFCHDDITVKRVAQMVARSFEAGASGVAAGIYRSTLRYNIEHAISLLQVPTANQSLFNDAIYIHNSGFSCSNCGPNATCISEEYCVCDFGFSAAYCIKSYMYPLDQEHHKKPIPPHVPWDLKYIGSFAGGFVLLTLMGAFAYAQRRVKSKRRVLHKRLVRSFDGTPSLKSPRKHKPPLPHGYKSKKDEQGNKFWVSPKGKIHHTRPVSIPRMEKLRRQRMKVEARLKGLPTPTFSHVSQSVSGLSSWEDLCSPRDKARSTPRDVSSTPRDVSSTPRELITPRTLSTHIQITPGDILSPRKKGE